MKYLFTMAAAVSLMSASAAQAMPRCLPTMTVAATHYPGAQVIPPSNNLVLPEGKSVAVEGQHLVVTGRLLDSRCIPIREAVVELWQADPFGKWFLAEGGDLVNPYPVFAGAGRTVTDANGQFTFITAFPGAVVIRERKGIAEVHAPQLNLRVKAQGFAPFSTALFFENDRRNWTDPVYSKLSAPERGSVTLSMGQGSDGNLDAWIDLILPGRAPYQTY